MTVIRRRDGYADELLRRHKEQLLAEIDEQIGRARMAGRSVGEGQDVVYALKEAEARQLLAEKRARAPTTGFPMLLAEAEATGRDARDLAAEVVAAADAEYARLAMLEGLRSGFKARVKAASTSDDADAQRGAFHGEIATRNIKVSSAALERRAARQKGTN